MKVFTVPKDKAEKLTELKRAQEQARLLLDSSAEEYRRLQLEVLNSFDARDYGKFSDDHRFVVN